MPVSLLYELYALALITVALPFGVPVITKVALAGFEEISL